MEFLLSRYRNLTVLLLAILLQLVLLAYQVKSNQDVRLIRVWAVTAVTPMARVLEFVREHTIGVVENYFVLVNVRTDNQRLKDELGKLKIQNQFLRTELQTADRAQALGAFQQKIPSRTLAARIIGTGTGANSRVVFIDRGSGSGIMRAMAVITPDGIVGKVLAAYPTASQVLLITDPSFAAGVISDKNRVHGTLKGIGQSKVIVDYVQNEEKVEAGEIFYTSGDDRIFPKGMPVGRVTVVREGKTFKEIYLVPTGFQQGLEEVLVVIEGVHGRIPEPQQISAASPDIYVMPEVMPEPKAGPGGRAATDAPAPNPIDVLMTDADRVRERYKKIGEQQGIRFGEPGKIPNFNAPPPASGGVPATAGSAVQPRLPAQPPATGVPIPSVNRAPAGGTSGAGSAGREPAVRVPAVTTNPAPGNRVPGTSGSNAVRAPETSPAATGPAGMGPVTTNPAPASRVPGTSDSNAVRVPATSPAVTRPAATGPVTTNPAPANRVPGTSGSNTVRVPATNTATTGPTATGPVTTNPAPANGVPGTSGSNAGSAGQSPANRTPAGQSVPAPVKRPPASGEAPGPVVNGTKPPAVKPLAAKPSVAKPSVAKPSVAKPSVAKPPVAKPPAVKPDPAKQTPLSPNPTPPQSKPAKTPAPPPVLPPGSQQEPAAPPR